MYFECGVSIDIHANNNPSSTIACELYRSKGKQSIVERRFSDKNRTLRLLKACGIGKVTRL